MSPRILYPAKLSIRYEGKLKIFSMFKVSEIISLLHTFSRTYWRICSKKQENKTRKKTWALGNEEIRCRKEAKGILRRMVKGESSMRAVHWG